MEHFEHPAVPDQRGKDVRYSWVSTSRFLFYCMLTVYMSIFIGCAYGLYANRYKGHPKVEVPANTQYNPKYK